MAKIRGALFSMAASGSLGDIVFDRRGYAYFKPQREDARSPRQGNYRQAMTVAQKCARVCGDKTRAQIRELTDDPAHWSAYLTKRLLGPQRATFLAMLRQYATIETDEANPWEMAATKIGLQEVHIPYAEDAAVSSGAQLFLLAQTLFSMGLYTGLGSPNGNADDWLEKIIS